MFTNYDTKANCYNFLRFMRFATNDGKTFFNSGVYDFSPNEYSPREYVVKYRKSLNGEKLYGIYVKTFYYDVCRPDGCCHGRDRSRFLSVNDIRGFYYGEMSSYNISNYDDEVAENA